MLKSKRKGKSSKALSSVQPGEKGYNVNRVGSLSCKRLLPSQSAKRRIPRAGQPSERRITRVFEEQIKERILFVELGMISESDIAHVRSAQERVAAMDLAKLMRNYQKSKEKRENKSKCSIPATFSFPVDLVERDIFVQIASNEQYNIKLKISEVRKVEAPLLPVPGGPVDV